jgi:hypothetical protein
MNIETTIRKYLEAWNETDPKARRQTIDALFTDRCRYVDPLASVDGRDALDGLIAGVQKQLPGLEFTLSGKVDAHHDQARFTWHAAPPGAGEPVAIGFDVVVLEGERIGSVFGFLDKVPG